MVLYIRKRSIRSICLLLVCLCFVLVFWLTNQITPLQVFNPTETNSQQIVIIDAGHGGVDGGAISLSGTKESDINLNIALRLDSLMHFCGAQTILTREDDRSLHDDSASTIRQKKVSDLHNRVAMIENEEDPLLISIHQNSFPGEQCKGLQTFYRDEESIPLAQNIQDSMHLFFDDENHRKPMEISDSVYLMKHITCKAVLVECGFLSNYADDKRLQEELYQKQVVIAITAAYCEQMNI